jgi:hypothetical protein
MPGLNKRFDVDRICTNIVVGGDKYIVHHPGGVKTSQSRTFNCVDKLWIWGQYERLLGKNGVAFSTLRNTDAVTYFH